MRVASTRNWRVCGLKKDTSITYRLAHSAARKEYASLDNFALSKRHFVPSKTFRLIRPCVWFACASTTSPSLLTLSRAGWRQRAALLASLRSYLLHVSVASLRAR